MHPSNQFKLLLFIFFFSGVAGLLYQVSWQRILTLYYGVGLTSVIIIVGVFMFGLGFGSLFGGRIIDKVKEKLKTYFIIELLIGIFGFLSIPILEFIGTRTAGSDYFMTLIYIFLFLAIPTFLMGSTLPILCRIFNDIQPDFLKNVSLAYFINTLGAAFGAVLASYVLISFFGLDIAVYFAAAINLALAFLILFIYKKHTKDTTPANYENATLEKSKIALRFAYLLVFIAGFLALGYEIIWFGIVSILSQSSPYAFSSSLFVYLLGIAFGSYGMGKLIKKYPRFYNKNLFYLIQILIAVTILFSFLSFFHAQGIGLSVLTKASLNFYPHPYVDLEPLGYEGYSGYKSYEGETIAEEFTYDSKLVSLFVLIFQNFDIFFWASWFMLLPTLLMGASFPLMASLASSNVEKTGTTVGGIYFVNVLGNVLGTLITGFVLLPNLGTVPSVIVFIGTGLLFLLAINYKSIMIRAAVIFLIFVVLIVSMPSNNAFFKSIHKVSNVKGILIEEGLDGLIFTSIHPTDIATAINGAVMGHRPAYNEYEHALTLLSYNKNPKDILVIGYGMGTVTEIMMMINNSNVTMVEISKSLMKNLKKLNETEVLINDPQLNIVNDDGRRFLYRTDKKYDIIVTDAVRPQSAYSNNIYSKEFFELISAHLKENGTFQLLIDRNYDIMPNTLMSVFEFGNIYRYRAIVSNDELVQYNASYLSDIILPEDYESQLTEYKTKLKIPSDNIVLFDQNDFDPETENARINRDFNPWVEYFVGDIVRKRYFNTTN